MFNQGSINNACIRKQNALYKSNDKQYVNMSKPPPDELNPATPYAQKPAISILNKRKSQERFLIKDCSDTLLMTVLILGNGSWAMDPRIRNLNCKRETGKRGQLSYDYDDTKAQTLPHSRLNDSQIQQDNDSPRPNCSASTPKTQPCRHAERICKSCSRIQNGPSRT